MLNHIRNTIFQSLPDYLSYLEASRLIVWNFMHKMTPETYLIQEKSALNDCEEGVKRGAAMNTLVAKAELLRKYTAFAIWIWQQERVWYIPPFPRQHERGFTSLIILIYFSFAYQF